MSDVTVIDPEKFHPMEYRVLIKIGKSDEKVGNLYLPESFKDKETHHQITGIFIKAGELAFTDAAGDPLTVQPKFGQSVVIAKYAGIAVKDKDGNLYRFANDKDIVAIISGDENV